MHTHQAIVSSLSQVPVTCVFTATDATVGLEEMSYEVNEGDSIEVCARVTSPSISCPISYGFSLTISTAPINAGFNVVYTSLRIKQVSTQCT